MIKTKKVGRLTNVVFVVVLFLVSSIATASERYIQEKADVSVQNIQHCPLQQYVSLGSEHEQGHTVWDVEYSNALMANRVATDSNNNVILVGIGGAGVDELPYAVIAKYGVDGKLKWSDERYALIIPGLISQVPIIKASASQASQSTETIFMEQSYKVCENIASKQSSMDLETSDDKELSNVINEYIMKGHQYVEPIFSKDQGLLKGRWVRFYDVAIDSNDNIIVVGEIQHRNTEDIRTIYVIKYDPDGNVLWDRIYKRYLLNPRDLCTGVAIDSNDNIFISVRSQEKDSNDYRGWVLKLSSNNGAKISESIHPGKSLVFYDLAVDLDDNLYIVGYYPSSGAMKVMKYSNDLTLLDEWGPMIRPIEPYAIDVDQNSNVIVAGSIGFDGKERQYLAKFSSNGNLLWINKSNNLGAWRDVVALSPDVTVVTGSNSGNETAGRFYVGLYDENGMEFKRFLGGKITYLQMFFSYGLDVDNNGDIVVAGLRWYAKYQFYMHAMKFYQ